MEPERETGTEMVTKISGKETDAADTTETATTELTNW